MGPLYGGPHREDFARPNNSSDHKCQPLERYQGTITPPIQEDSSAHG